MMKVQFNNKMDNVVNETRRGEDGIEFTCHIIEREFGYSFTDDDKAVRQYKSVTGADSDDWWDYLEPRLPNGDTDKSKAIPERERTIIRCNMVELFRHYMLSTGGYREL